MPGLTRSVLIAGAAMTCLAGPAARGETLADAIALAYRSNPTLQAQRALQRATDETVVTARSGLRPTASIGVTAEYTETPAGLSSSLSRVETNSGGVALTLTQPLFNGGRTTAAVQAAEATVTAGRELLRSTEAQVLQTVVQAYTDVRRDQQIVAIRQNNLSLLSSQLEEARAKFEVGQITRTDVAQSEAQLAAARALLSSAQAQLQISRANYTAVVGQNPGELAPEPPVPGLPPTVDQAFDVAEAENPTLLRARSTEQASRARIAQAKAANHPTVSLQGSLGYSGLISPLDPKDYGRAVTAEAVVTQPLFTGGLNASNIRSAFEQNNADRLNIEGARRQVVQQVSQAWNIMASSRANVTSDLEQVRAARVAFEGAQEEYRVGLRTTLDVLIAQQNLRDAELALVQARHDAYVAEATLLGAMGRLEARYLVSGVDGYDPADNSRRVRSAGATPWDGLVERLDAIGAAKVRPEQASTSALPVSGVPTMRPPAQAETSPPPLSVDQPTAHSPQ
jgi:outer membrane protein